MAVDGNCLSPQFFYRINKAAYLFGGLFIFQGILFLMLALKRKITIHIHRDAASIMGMLLLLFSLVIYPLLSYLQNHVYPASPTFGLPCPTTIFTFAIMLIAAKQLPSYIIIIPLIWSLIGSVAAFKLGMYEDFGLLVSAIVFVIIFKTERYSLKTVPEHHL